MKKQIKVNENFRFSFFLYILTNRNFLLMAQPVRQTIKETHPELSEKPIYTLLVDGNNLLRASMADSKMNADGTHYGGVFQFFFTNQNVINDC